MHNCSNYPISQATYSTLSRRRRSVLKICENPKPGAAYFGNTSTSGTIGGLRMFTKYVIILKSFNAAGDSDPSSRISVKTAEGGKEFNLFHFISFLGDYDVIHISVFSFISFYRNRKKQTLCRTFHVNFFNVNCETLTFTTTLGDFKNIEKRCTLKLHYSRFCACTALFTFLFWSASVIEHELCYSYYHRNVQIKQ